MRWKEKACLMSEWGWWRWREGGFLACLAVCVCVDWEQCTVRKEVSELLLSLREPESLPSVPQHSLGTLSPPTPTLQEEMKCKQQYQKLPSIHCSLFVAPASQTPAPAVYVVHRYKVLVLLVLGSD